MRQLVSDWLVVVDLPNAADAKRRVALELV